MRSEREYNYKLAYNLMTYVLISICLSIFGAVSNTIALRDNGHKMPVLFQEYTFEDDTHFSYTNRESVEHWYFTDILHIGKTIYSIGDILMWVALVGCTIILIVSIYLNLSGRCYLPERQSKDI